MPRETMVRTFTLTSLAALLAATALTVATPAQAQIGTISPIRRRAAWRDFRVVSRSRRCPMRTTRRSPRCAAGPRTAVASDAAASGTAGNVMPGPVESQPLAPPPGSAAAPPNRCRPSRSRRRRVPRVRPVSASPAEGRAGAADAGEPAAGDEVVTEPPAQKIVNKKATFSGLDKITGRIINFDEDIGETVQFGALSGSRPMPATRGRRRKPPIPTPSSRWTRSPCRAR